MKKILSSVAMMALAAGVFASPRIVLEAPHVTSWTQTISGFPYTATSTELAELNSQLDASFLEIQNALNQDVLSNFKELVLLSRGFANASSASFDNASLQSLQNYDLFAFTLGTNLGASSPVVSFNSADYIDAVSSIPEEGDVYAGLATGGIAGQLGINLGFWVPKLYANVKVGAMPSLDLSGSSIQQFMFGVGVNYTLMSQYDFLAGLFKWRGVSVGTGLTYNGSTINVSVPIDDQETSSFEAEVGGQPVELVGKATDIAVDVRVRTSSVVIPFDIMTSVQFLYLFHLGLGLGLDFAFSGSELGLGASSDLTILGLEGATIDPGSAKIVGGESKNGGDFFLPRIAASLGFDIAIVKFDFPISYYPLSQSVAFGFTTGIVW